MTTTEIADIEAWKDDEIINECGVGLQFATIWGSSKKASTRQICGNMVLEGLCPKVAKALFRGKNSVAPEFMSTYFDKVQTENKLPRTALGMIKIPKAQKDMRMDRDGQEPRSMEPLQKHSAEQDGPRQHMESPMARKHCNHTDSRRTRARITEECDH
jgi:hypothetical protein